MQEVMGSSPFTSIESDSLQIPVVVSVAEATEITTGFEWSSVPNARLITSIDGAGCDSPFANIVAPSFDARSYSAVRQSEMLSPEIQVK